MIGRQKNLEIHKLLHSHSAVALIGPRQCGKTTLALEIASEHDAIYLDLESPSDLIKLKDPELYLSSLNDKLVILDEIQRVPELFSVLRGQIDQRRRQGKRTAQFLLLGSASLELLKQSSESLAGRIAFCELTPLNLLELGPAIDELWLLGGFPDSLLAHSAEESLLWRRSFIKTYLERDIPQMGFRIPAETLRRFWTMLAHNQSQLFNAAPYAAGLGVKGQTTSRYLDLLVDLLLVRKLSPWRSNLGKRMVKSSKIYIRDSGILHSLLDLQNFEQLLSHPVLGGSWEGFAIENIISTLPGHFNYGFYRTSAGAEVDLVIEWPNHKVWAIEIKRSSTPQVSKGFLEAQKDLKPERSFITYAGNETFPINQNTTAISLFDLIMELQSLVND